MHTDLQMRRAAADSPAVHDDSKLKVIADRLDRIPDRPYFYLGDHTALTTTVFGHKIFLNTRDVSVAPHIMLDGKWEMWIANVFRAVLREGMTALDIGANCGWFTLLAAALTGSTGKVHAFEPNKELFPLLQRSVMVNGFWERTKLVNQGVMAQSGERQFHQPVFYAGSGNFFWHHTVKLGDLMDVVNVPCVSLDDYFAALGNSHVDFIKIDAEGAEPEIIAGAHQVIAANPHLKMVMEYMADNKPAFEYLAGQGFIMAVIEEDSRLTPVRPDQLEQVPMSQMIYLTRG